MSLPLFELRIAGVEFGAAKHLPLRKVHAIDDSGFVAVLKVLAHTGKINLDLDTMTLELSAWSDARKHQQLWGVEGSARKNHLARGANFAALAGSVAGSRRPAIEAFSRKVLHSNRATIPVEKNARHQRIQHNFETVGILRRHLQHALPRAITGVLVGGQRQIAQADGILPHSSPVIRIEVALKHPPDAVSFFSNILDRNKSRIGDHLEQLAVAHGQHRDRLLRVQPSAEAMTGRVDSQPRKPAIRKPVATILQSLKILSHVAGVPRRI